MVAKSKKIVKQSDTLKWLEKAAGAIKAREPNPRYALTWAYADDGRVMAADGFRFHMVWDNTTEAGFIALKNSEEPPTYRGKRPEMTFPDVMKVLRREDTALLRATVDVAAMQQALKIASVFGRDSDDAIYLIFLPVSGAVMVTGHSAERGSAQTLVKAAFASVPDDLARCISVNCKYLADALAGFSDTVTLHYFGGTAEHPAPLTVGTYGERVACIMPKSRKPENLSHIGQPVKYDTDLPPWIEMAVGIDALSAMDNPPRARKKTARKSSRPTKRSEAPEVVSVTTSDDGLTHERVEYRRGVAAFADIHPRLTPDTIAEFQRITALEPFERVLTRTLQRSKEIHGAATIGYRTARRAILIACENDDYERRCYALHLRGDEAQLISYRKRHDRPVETKAEATISLRYLGDAWAYVQALAASYGYSPAPAVASAAV